jgi:hypothetical protein
MPVPTDGSGVKTDDSGSSFFSSARKMTDTSGVSMSSTFTFESEGSKKPSKETGPKPEPVGTSQLNPADTLVDESMPKYSAPFSFTSKPPVSDEDVAEGKPLRIAARKKVLDALKDEFNDQKRIKRDINSKWNLMTEPNRQRAQRDLDFFNKQPDYLDFFNFLKKEVVWWDNNLELSPREVTTRDTKYDETLAQKIATITNVRNFMNTSANAAATEQTQKQLESKQAIVNRTIYDDINDSFAIMSKVLFWLIYILVGLRCASFAANETMYKPLAYRVLIFFYTFLFVPVFGPYYLWIVIKRLIWKTPSPMYEGFFPMNPYDPSEPLNLNRRLFGYADTPQLRQWMDEQRQNEQSARDAAVVSKNIKQEIIQEHS